MHLDKDVVRPAFNTGGRSWVLIAIVSLVIAVAGNALLRNKAWDLHVHPDASIPVEVLSGMHERGDFDTNWQRADRLPDFFRVPSYNFSGYLLTSYGVTAVFAPAAFEDRDAMQIQLIRLSRIWTIATLCLAFAVVCRRLGMIPAALCAVAIAVTPQFFQDAHYPRPEALASFLFLVCFVLAGTRPKHVGAAIRTAALIALVVGFLASIKVTYLIAAIFCAGPIVALHASDIGFRQGLGTLIKASPFCAAALAAGFVVGTPGVLIDIQPLFDGLAGLRKQYEGLHPPHGIPDSTTAERIRFVAGYYAGTVGVPMVLLHVIGYRSNVLGFSRWLGGALIVATAVLLLRHHVFFERNLSPLVPIFMVISVAGMAHAGAWVSRHSGRLAGGAMTAGVTLALGCIALVKPLGVVLDLQPLFTREGVASQRANVDANVKLLSESRSLSRVSYVPYADVFAQVYPQPDPCLLLVVDSFGDFWSTRYIRGLPRFWRLASTIPSRFSEIPTSTLHTYHERSRIFFVPSGHCRGQ